MSKTLLFFAAGIAVGAVSTVLLTKDPGALPEVKPGEAMEATVKSPELIRALEQVGELMEENQELRDQVREPRKPRTEVVLAPDLGDAAPKEGDPEREERGDARRAGMEDRIKGMMASRMQARISRLKSAITLSDGQAAGIEAFMAERNDLRMEFMSKRFSGELTEEEEAEYLEKLQSMSVGDYLKENLNEEQYGEYEEYLQEQNEAELASYASRQLSNLIQTVRLSDEQKDQAYEAFYVEAEDSIPEGEEFSARRRSFGPEAADNLQTQLIALEGILDEGQMEAYRIQMESRQQAVGGGGPGRGPGR